MNSRRSPYRAAIKATVCFLVIAIATLAFHAKSSQYDSPNGSSYLGKATKMSDSRAQRSGMWHPLPVISPLPDRPVTRLHPAVVEHPLPRTVPVLAFRFRPPPRFL